MTLVDYFNTLEIVLWSLLGLGLLAVSLRRRKLRTEATMAGLLFLAFAGSDAVELTTGAWWRPWWLLVWKAACIVGLVLVGVRVCRRRKKKQ
jgi:hypothetical protein